MLNYSQWQQLLLMSFHLINDLKKIIVHLVKYHSVFQTDVIAFGELNLLLAIFYSSIHNFWQYLMKYRKNLFKLALSMLGSKKIIFAESRKKIHRIEF